MKNISYTGYTIVKSAFRLFLGLTLAAFLLCGCGRGSSGPTVRPGTTDEMWGNEVDDAEIYAFMYEGRVYTADTIDEINPYDATQIMTDGGFYKLTADVKYLNGGVAGYVNYPDIKSVICELSGYKERFELRGDLASGSSSAEHHRKEIWSLPDRRLRQRRYLSQ